jgi:hypothetical protein
MGPYQATQGPLERSNSVRYQASSHIQPRRATARISFASRGSGVKSPQLHAKLQVAALFRAYFWLPVLATFLSWERTGADLDRADLVQPTPLTSGDVLLFVRRVGAVAS